jgi:hypothetical protein
MAECLDIKKNINKSKCNRLPKLFKYMIWTPNDFALTEADLATLATLKTTLQDALKDSSDIRIYLFPKFSNAPEGASEATIYVESALGSRKVRNGNYRWRHFISKSMCLHRAMFTHAGSDGRIIYVDVENQMLLTKDSDGNYRGLSLDLFNPEKLKMSTGDDLTESPVYVALADNLEIDKSGYIFDIGTVITELEPLTDVDLTVEIVSVTVFKVTVKNSCDGTPISGLVQADFAVTTTAGAAQVPTAFAEPNDDGVYTLTKSTNFADGFVDLVAPSALSIDAYESTGKAVVNVP